MKLSFGSIFILVSIVWNIFFSDYVLAMSSSPHPINLTKVTLTDSKTISTSISNTNYNYYWNLLAEEMAENEEENMDTDIIPFLLVKLLSLELNPLKEKKQYQVFNDNYSSTNHLFIKYCSLKIPLNS